MVGDYPLAVWRKAGEDWRVVSWGSPAADRWLQETRLKDQRFKSSRQAAEAIGDALHFHPQLEVLPKARCRKNQVGWSLSGDLKAVRRGSRWHLIDQNNRIIGVTRTLNGAARKAQWLIGKKQLRV